jgi:ATP synthase protein I
MSDRENGSFEERLRAAQTRQAAATPKPAPGTSDSAGAMGIGVRVGVELVSALAVGLAIGWGLDWLLGTRPWFLALFVLLGGAAGVANVWRLMMPPKRRAGPGRSE